MSRALLPETLQLDAARLHEAQNAFQQLVVLAACLLLAGRYRASEAGQVRLDARS